MIVFDLKCDRGHVFEAWFKDSATFERQRKRREVDCAICGSTSIAKAPMAPRLSRGRSVDAAEKPAAATPKAYANDPAATRAGALMKELAQLRHHIEKNCEYVGPRFPEEARKMHYNETEKRSIYGEADDGEAAALAEEGIEFARVPWLPRRDA